MAPAKHQRPVQTLRAHGLDPALGIGVRLRRQRPDRRADDLPFPAVEHLVGPGSELGVVVAEHESHRHAPIAQLHRGVPCLLGDHAVSGCAVTSVATTRLVLSWMKNHTWRVLSRIVSTVKKSQATIPRPALAGTAPRSVRTVVAPGPGHGVATAP